MIKDRDAASKVLAAAFEASGILDQSIQHVIAGGTAEEIAVYKRAVGNVMAEILFRILNPIIAEHPELTPEGRFGSKKDG
jgi:hypothetical protein